MSSVLSKCLVRLRRALVRTASPVAFEDRILDLIRVMRSEGGLRWINVSGCGAGHQGTHGIQSLDYINCPRRQLAVTQRLLPRRPINP